MSPYLPVAASDAQSVFSETNRRNLLRQMWELAVPFWTPPRSVGQLPRSGRQSCLYVGGSIVSARVAKCVGDQLDAHARHDAGTLYRVIVLTLAAQLGSSVFNVLCNLPFQIMLQR